MNCPHKLGQYLDVGQCSLVLPSETVIIGLVFVAFCSELCVTLAYLEACHVQDLRNIQNPVKQVTFS